MDRQMWRDEIMGMPVFDTHTHLNMPGVPVPARDFWDIAHYFWFQQELWAVGYPQDADRLPEEERISRFVDAFAATRSTVWNHVVRQVFRTLHGIELGNRDSVRRADQAVRASFRQPDWCARVIERVAVRHIAVNHLQHARSPELPGVGVAVPSQGRFDRAAWIERILRAADPRQAGREAEAEIERMVEELHEAGIRGMRVSIEPLEAPGAAAWEMPAELPAGATEEHVAAFLTHAQLQSMGRRGLFAQLFLGIGPVTLRTSMAIDDPRRIPGLYPMFERYACPFELVIGAPHNNLDAAQAARIYPNVHLGGLWWYNFRSSTYRQAMQYRLEAVPASKASLVASDARCIEWCYGKVLLVKWLLADFLHDQVESGWIDRDEARWVAQEWLHDAAARRYLPSLTEDAPAERA